MENELAVMERHDLSVSRSPIEVLAEAKKAAEALKDVISKKAKPVMFNNEQYLEFEDLQTLGRFYGVTAKVTESKPIDLSGIRGFEAHAVAIHTSSGQEISAADAMCMEDEKNWASKPLFQLRSMAQTRACAKALRNVLAWVVVLAGYKATPAEEIVDSVPNVAQSKAKLEEDKPEGFLTDKIATDKTIRYIETLAKKKGYPSALVTGWLESIGQSALNNISQKQASQLIDMIAAYEPGK